MPGLPGHRIPQMAYCSLMNKGYTLIKLADTRPASCPARHSSLIGVRSFPTMRLGHLVLISSIALSLAIPAVASGHKRRTTSATATRVSGTRVSGKRAVKSKSKPKILGQRTIDDQRATQIQTALTKAHYLSGEPSGHWDAQSQAAMEKLQGDNGWQTKLVPDSRALIKLGLGPNSDSVASAATISANSPNN